MSDNASVLASCLAFAITDSSFTVIPAEGEVIFLRYVELVATVLATVSVTTSFLLIVTAMALTKKLRAPIDAMFCQISAGLLLVLTVAAPYRTYLHWSEGSKHSMSICVFTSVLELMGVFVTFFAYFAIVFMQLFIIKKGMQDFKTTFTQNRLCVIIAAMWTLSASVSCSCLMGGLISSGTFAYSPLYNVCGIQSDVLPLTTSIKLAVVAVSVSCFVGAVICHCMMIAIYRNHIKVGQLPQNAPSRETNYQLPSSRPTSRTQERVTRMVLKVIIFIAIYLAFLLPIMVEVGLDMVSCDNNRHHSSRQITVIIAILGLMTVSPSYILVHSLHRKVCYLLLMRRYDDIRRL